MNLRHLLVVMPACIGCLLSGCSTGPDKKVDPKPSPVARAKATPDTNPDEKPSKGKVTPEVTEPAKAEEPKPPKEVAKAASEAWTKHGF